MSYLHPNERRRRRRIAGEVAAEGGGVREFAKRANMKIPAAYRWLDNHESELLKKLREDSIRPSTQPQLVRLLLLRVAMEFKGGMERIAPGLKVSPAALSMWKRRHAPDGVDSAIRDLWPDDSPPEFRPAVFAGNVKA